MVQTLISLWLGLVSPGPLGAAHAGDAHPISMRILAFSGENLYEATETILSPKSDGTWSSDVGPHFVYGDCEDLLSQFQRRPLEQMRKTGYISQSMFDTLMDFSRRGLKATQLILVSQYTDLPRHEALKLFGGNIPEDRSDMATPETDSAADQTTELVRISRGTMYAIRGFVPQVDERGRIKMKSLSVPWELDQELPSGLSRIFNRNQVPFLTEIGRAFMEKGPLPGSTEAAVQALTNYLSNEARAWGIPLTNYVLSAHFLDPQHTRLFTAGFPLRPLTADWQKELESDLTGQLAGYLNRPLPKGRQWQDYGNSVVIGTLAEAVRRFPLEKVSHTAKTLMSRSEGRLSPEQAFDFHRSHVAAVRQMFDFAHPDFPIRIRPIIVRDFGTALLESGIIRQVQSLGLWRGFKHTEDFFSGFSLQEPDLSSDVIVDRDLHLLLPHQTLRPNRPQQEDLQPHPALMLSNIDPHLLRQFPLTGLAAVVLAIADHLRQRFEGFSPERYQAALLTLNQRRKDLGQSPLRNWDFQAFLDHYPIVVATSSDEAREQARRLGAKPRPGLTLRFDFNLSLDAAESPLSATMKAELKADQVQHYAFQFSEIQALARQFPQWSQGMRRSLRPGDHELRMKSLLSGAF